MKRPNKAMIEHLNLKLKKEGSCLRYIERHSDCGMISYALRISDKYISYAKYEMNLNISKEFENMVRDFFKKYDVEDTGFTNTVATLLVVG